MNFHYFSVTCPLATHVNVRVIGIARETMALPFQFAVEFVDQDVRQQRREQAVGR